MQFPRFPLRAQSGITRRLTIVDPNVYTPEAVDKIENTGFVVIPKELFAEVFGSSEYQNQDRKLMNFRITTTNFTPRSIYASVLSGDAPMDMIALPPNLIRDLGAIVGHPVEVTFVVLPAATSLTLRANTYRFYQLHNPRIVVEWNIRNYPVIFTGQTISISHASRDYQLEVRAVAPTEVGSNGVYGVSTLNTDVDLEYQDAIDTPRQENESTPSSFVPVANLDQSSEEIDHGFQPAPYYYDDEEEEEDFSSSASSSIPPPMPYSAPPIVPISTSSLPVQLGSQNRFSAAVDVFGGTGRRMGSKFIPSTLQPAEQSPLPAAPIISSISAPSETSTPILAPQIPSPSTPIGTVAFSGSGRQMRSAAGPIIPPQPTISSP